MIINAELFGEIVVGFIVKKISITTSQISINFVTLHRFMEIH